jgi:hypothetical protein
MSKEYLVVMCPKCKRGQVADASHQTRQCPYCTFIIDLPTVQVFHRAPTQKAARAFLGRR